MKSKKGTMRNLCIAICVVMISWSFSGRAQEGLLNKLKDKAKARANQRMDEGIDKSIDKTEESIQSAASRKEKEPKSAEAPVNRGATSLVGSIPSGSIKSYSRYDFVPGERIIQAEDFSQDVVGEFPLMWATNNRGEVVTLEGMANKWLRLFPGGRVLSPQINDLPDNYTVEFDFLISVKEEDLGYVIPEIYAKLVQLSADEKVNEYVQDPAPVSELTFTIAPVGNADLKMGFESRNKGVRHMWNDQKPLKTSGIYTGKVHHTAIWVQKGRMRMWVDAEKVYDMPQAVPLGTQPDRIEIDIPSSLYTDEQLGLYVTDFKIAVGAPDLRTKLLTEGKWVTTGILFDVNSDQIKPQSSGVLQEISKLLKENGALNVKIVGHTDAEGDEKMNLDLSKRRAVSVKNALVNNYGIDASRLVTDGMGESKPVTDNKTKEGRSQNRRVEFVKQ